MNDILKLVERLPPPILLALVLASVYAFFFHLVFGRRLRGIPIYWLASIVGFFGGYLIAALSGQTLWRLGTVPIVPGTVGSALLLFLASRVRV